MDADVPKTRTVLQTLPLAEEQIEISKTAQVGDIVRVDLKTELHAELVQTTLESHSAAITRHPIDRVVDTIPEIRRDGDITIIPVVEERLVVHKELVLIEEIHIERETQSRSVEDNVVLRRQVPTINRVTPKTD